ncbi:MAG: arginase [Salibacteraceae bacterium]
MSKLKIIDVKSELGAGTRGSSLGPAAIRVAAWNAGSSWFQDKPVTEVPTLNERLHQASTTRFAKQVEGIAAMYQRIADTIAETISKEHLTLVLSGDHSSAGGTIAGIKKAFPQEKIGAIWIDAHADLHSPYTTPSGNVHGMPLAVSLSEDNVQCQKNTPSEETIAHWNALKNTGVDGPKIDPKHLAFVAVRDTETEEEALMDRLNLPNHTVAQVREKGGTAIARQLLEQIADCDNIYISFDVDSLDPEISVGTGTPVPDGLLEKEVIDMISELLQHPKVVCLEVVEVNPTLDQHCNAMADAAFRIIKGSMRHLS